MLNPLCVSVPFWERNWSHSYKTLQVLSSWARRGDKAGCCSRQTKNSQEICSKGYSPASVMPPPPPGIHGILPERLCQVEAMFSSKLRSSPGKLEKQTDFTTSSFIASLLLQLQTASSVFSHFQSSLPPTCLFGSHSPLRLPSRAPWPVVSWDLFPSSPPLVTMAPCFVSRKCVWPAWAGSRCVIPSHMDFLPESFNGSIRT